MEYSMHIVIFYSVSPVVTGDRVIEIITTQTLIFILYNFFLCILFLALLTHLSLLNKSGPVSSLGTK